MKHADAAPESGVYTTSSQTVGPYLHIGLTWLVTDDLVGEGVTGERYVVEGRVVDADGEPVNDALIEIWQANAFGRYDHPEDTRDLPLEAGFKGFGRIPTDASGAFRFSTIKPGAVPAADGRMQAPHINVTIFMRGMLKQLNSRIYFPKEPANASDPVLASVPAERRDTLIARPIGDRLLQWNVVLQGDGETVFFEY
jgi:protocatechuate 3,4-dioxygenase alpha subunit